MELVAATPESASAALAIALAVHRKKSNPKASRASRAVHAVHRKKGKPKASHASRAVLAARVIAKTDLGI
jgi:hypothetical protein